MTYFAGYIPKDRHFLFLRMNIKAETPLHLYRFKSSAIIYHFKVCFADFEKGLVQIIK